MTLCSNNVHIDATFKVVTTFHTYLRNLITVQPLVLLVLNLYYHRHHHHFILPKNKNIIFNNTTEIQLAGRQKNIKFTKLAPILYTILQNDKHTLQRQQKVKYLFSLAADNNETLSRKIYKQ